ncbi:MAG: RelA/SpoT domain protein [Clostridiales bacterium]|nr:RelA/SpoT domain protein [Clostridiales bacterium]
MTYEEFYGSSYEIMKEVEGKLLELVTHYSATAKEKEGVKPVVYCCSRIKEPDSMLRKLEKHGLEPSGKAALSELYDAVGVRVVCAFADDVYRLVKWLKTQPLLQIMEEKDYYAYPKANGYRSYHILVQLAEGKNRGFRAEIQIRTIAIDFWATLEHQIKYKKNVPHEGLIRSELKRCADEIASLDLSMQTIRDILQDAE